MQGLETKFHRLGLEQGKDAALQGYASIFGVRDQGGDIVMPGAFAASLRRLAAHGRKVSMLWQHDQAQPIGVWDEVAEDAFGLRVAGRLLPEVARGREAAALLAAGAVDGLSIGYRVLRAEKLPQGGRKLHEVDLWEVSLVTFPMLAEARLGTKSDAPVKRQIAQALAEAARALRG
ncbi:MAG: HK97 family phage prohead protease [Paracoccaceae bacterium]